MALLPAPTAPYPDWSRFLTAVLSHGLNVRHMQESILAQRVNEAAPAIVEAMTRRNEAHAVRPSAFLACARQSFLLLNDDHEPTKMPDNIGSTFAMGHMLHEIHYAALFSALPEGFEAFVELPVDMPSWWPKGERFNQAGTVDCLIVVTDWTLAKAFLPEDTAPGRMLLDFKSMGGFSFRKHGKTIFGEDPDGFGYVSQLATYSDTDKVQCSDTGAILAGINRDSLTQPPKLRFIEPRVLQGEINRVKAALALAEEGTDPGEEFLERHGSEAYFYCGRGDKGGYCPVREGCKARAVREFTKDNEGYAPEEAGE